MSYFRASLPTSRQERANPETKKRKREHTPPLIIPPSMGDVFSSKEEASSQLITTAANSRYPSVPPPPPLPPSPAPRQMLPSGVQADNAVEKTEQAAFRASLSLLQERHKDKLEEVLLLATENGHFSALETIFADIARLPEGQQIVAKLANSALKDSDRNRIRLLRCCNPPLLQNREFSTAADRLEARDETPERTTRHVNYPKPDDSTAIDMHASCAYGHFPFSQMAWAKMAEGYNLDAQNELLTFALRNNIVSEENRLGMRFLLQAVFDNNDAPVLSFFQNAATYQKVYKEWGGQYLQPACLAMRRNNPQLTAPFVIMQMEPEVPDDPTLIDNPFGVLAGHSNRYVHITSLINELKKLGQSNNDIKKYLNKTSVFYSSLEISADRWHLGAIDVLLRHGENITTRALVCTVIKGSLEVAEDMINRLTREEKKKVINDSCEIYEGGQWSKTTPLMAAIKYDRPDIVQLLKKNEAEHVLEITAAKLPKYAASNFQPAKRLFHDTFPAPLMSPPAAQVSPKPNIQVPVSRSSKPIQFSILPMHDMT